MATTTAPSIELGPLGLENPMGTDGFEFVEYAAPDAELLRGLFTKMGFPEVARHKSKNVTLHKQGDCNFVINAEPGSYADDYAQAHGPSACAMAFRVKDAAAAHQRALRLGATNVEVKVGDGEMAIPAIEGIGGSRLFFVDRYGEGKGVDGSIYEIDFDFHPDWRERMAAADSHLTYIDHLTHNVNRGNMATWAGFYEKLFNFREIRYFDIEGKLTGLHSRAMTSPDGKIRIPINEDAGEKGQIEEYLQEYRGEGIQHVAMGSTDLYATIEQLEANGLGFMPAPNEIYYSRIDRRLPKHGEPVERLKKDGILIDGEGVVEGGYTKVLLQRFSKTVIGPIFFEFIQRKGDDGFGEGNFKALFESIEEDQIRRGVLKVTA
jgi:4-hydroxyphenylpyruvate dioxygenase